MSFKSYLFSGFIARLLFLATLFFVNALIARVAGAAGSGNFFYTINNLSIIVLISSFSIESGMTYYLSKKQITSDEATDLSFIWSVGSSILFSVFVLFIPGDFLKYGNHVFWQSAFFIMGNLLISFFSGLLYAKREFSLPQLIPAFSNLSIIGYCGWVLYKNEPAEPETLMFVFTGSYLIAGLMLALYFIKKYRTGRLFSSDASHTFRFVFRYSGIAFTANLAAFLMYRVDYWILEYYNPKHISDAAMGNYIQVAKLVQLFLFAPSVLATIFFPLTAANESPDQPVIIKKTLWQLSVVNIFIIALLLVTGHWLFPFAFGGGFSDMYQCFILISPGIMAIAIVRVLASYFAGSNKVRLNITGTLVALGMIIAFNIFLIPKWGINGAAVADSIGYLAYFLFLYWYFRKNNRK